MQIKCEQGSSSTNRCKWEKEHIDAVRQHVEGLVEWHKASVAASIKMLFLAFYFRTTADNISVLRQQQHKQQFSKPKISWKLCSFAQPSSPQFPSELRWSAHTNLDTRSTLCFGGLFEGVYFHPNYGMCCQVGLIVHTRLPWMYAGAGRHQTESHMYILK